MQATMTIQEHSPVKHTILERLTEDDHFFYFKGFITTISWDYFEIPAEFSLFMDDGDEFILKPFFDDQFHSKEEEIQYLRKFNNREVVVLGERKGHDTIEFLKIKPIEQHYLPYIKTTGANEDYEEYDLHLYEDRRNII